MVADSSDEQACEYRIVLFFLTLYDEDMTKRMEKSLRPTPKIKGEIEKITAKISHSQ